MTETTKTVFEKYEIRKTKVQKNKFIEFVKDVSEKNGYSYRIEEGRGLGMKPRNIVVGDTSSAKVVFSAHYDTCARMPFPNFITPKNVFIYIIYQLLVTVGILIAAVAVGMAVGFLIGLLNLESNLESELIRFAVCGSAFAMFLLMMIGPANRHTANDNTSGVTVLLDTMQALPEELRSKVAFVFFDMEEVGLVGSGAFYAKHKAEMKDKLLINFDCVSDGKHILLALNKKASIHKEVLSSAFVSNEKYTVDITSKGVFYPSDQMKFPLGVGVASLKKSKKLGVLYMNRIHTKRDTVYDEENISFLVDSAIKLSQNI